MTNSFSHEPAAEAAGKAGIARLIRQICVLREQAEFAAASRMEQGDLSSAVSQFREEHGAAALPESELHDLFAVEKERVAQVAILSELLIPRLVVGLPAVPLQAAPARPATGAAVPLSPVPRAGRETPDIPDLLDAMLAAERAGPRTRR